MQRTGLPRDDARGDTPLLDLVNALAALHIAAVEARLVGEIARQSSLVPRPQPRESSERGTPLPAASMKLLSYNREHYHDA